MTSEILRNEECNPNLLKKKGLELLDAGKTNEAVECFSNITATATIAPS